MMDLKEENPRALELRISRGFNLASFNPHGISTFIDSGKSQVATNILKPYKCLQMIVEHRSLSDQ